MQENTMEPTKQKKELKNLRDVLAEYGNHGDVHIMYRSNYEGIDMFIGECIYSNGELISCDGDNYNFEDLISDYSFETDINGKEYIIAWI